MQSANPQLKNALFWLTVGFFFFPYKKKDLGLLWNKVAKLPLFSARREGTGMSLLCRDCKCSPSGWAAESNDRKGHKQACWGQQGLLRTGTCVHAHKLKRAGAGKGISRWNNRSRCTVSREQPFTGKRHSHPYDLFLGRKEDVSIKSVTDSL